MRCYETDFFRQDHDGHVTSVAFSKDGKFLATGSTDSTIFIYYLNNRDVVEKLCGHEDSVTSVAFSPITSCFIASASVDETVCIWNVYTETCEMVLSGHENRVQKVCYSSDGSRLVSCSYDESIRVWDVNTGACVRVLRDDNVYCHVFGGKEYFSRPNQRQRRVLDVAYSPCDDTLAAVYLDNRLRIWKADDDLKVIYVKQGTNCLAYSPRGCELACGSTDAVVTIWDATTFTFMKQIDSVRYYVNIVGSVSFSMDGKFVATNSDTEFLPDSKPIDNTIRIWHVASDQLVRTMVSHKKNVNSVAFSPDTIHLASGANDSCTIMWRLVDFDSFLNYALPLLFCNVTPYLVLDILDMLLTESSFAAESLFCRMAKIRALERLQRKVKKACIYFFC